MQSIRRLNRLGGLLMILFALQACERADMTPVSAGVANSAGTTDMKIVAFAASDARQRCHVFMHEDADEYVQCVDSVLQQSASSGDKSARLPRRLGVAYFGWVGANNSARIALPGALQAAEHYRHLFRSLQVQLAISDEALCSTVPGTCHSRIAQLVEQEALDPTR